MTVDISTIIAILRLFRLLKDHYKASFNLRDSEGFAKVLQNIKKKTICFLINFWGNDIFFEATRFCCFHNKKYFLLSYEALKIFFFTSIHISFNSICT